MTESSHNHTGIPKWFWIVSILALLWNLMGLLAFFAQVFMTEEMLAELPAEQQELYRNMPAWVNIAFAVATFGGVIGCIGLLLRKSWAWLLFVISLIGVVAQNGYAWFFTDSLAVLGPQVVVMPILIILIGIGLILFAKSSIKKGWLK